MTHDVTVISIKSLFRNVSIYILYCIYDTYANKYSNCPAPKEVGTVALFSKIFPFTR